MLNLQLHNLQPGIIERIQALTFIQVPPEERDCTRKKMQKEWKREILVANYASQLYELTPEMQEDKVQQWEVNLIA